MDTETHLREFALVEPAANPTVAFLRRTIILAALLAGLGLLLLYAVGRMPVGSLLFLGTFVLVATVFFVWRFGQENRGIVTAGPEGFAVKRRRWRDSYSWSDVAGVRVTTLSELGGLSASLGRIVRLDCERPLVEVALRKNPRVSLMGNRVGTNVWGIPRLGARLHLYLTHPEEFARFASTWLSR